ncbi:hypothetical protein N9C89_15650 [Halocynthiibacter sp. SDUM655004]|uniref:Uncharacterized protein n=1 Tax=Halocynthiibacter halioticoli TaxID=2986804 RepID=A0AAE3J116_9RHOB|nr:hypothetical protein [Halocynthiibacter halioticoli]MCW4058998.1 hypothetical protein [Halocynthiibacter sp. SDUM655004]
MIGVAALSFSYGKRTGLDAAPQDAIEEPMDSALWDGFWDEASDRQLVCGQIFDLVEDQLAMDQFLLEEDMDTHAPPRWD